MFREVTADEPARGQDLDVAAAKFGEYAADELAAQPTALTVRVDLGVEQAEDTRVALDRPVLGEAGHHTVNNDLEAIPVRFLDDVDGHTATVERRRKRRRRGPPPASGLDRDVAPLLSQSCSIKIGARIPEWSTTGGLR
jgi:hypothetical protein